jgi:hypothetical protein
VARITKPKPAPVDPHAWIVDGRWSLAPGWSLHQSECDRALWLAGRWATARAAGPEMTLLAASRVISGPTPPKIDGWLAETILCPTCPQAKACAGEVEVGCRTCRHVTADGRWRCAKHDIEPDAELQRVGCEEWAP